MISCRPSLVVGDRPFALGIYEFAQIPITANSFYTIFAIIVGRGEVGS